MALADQREEGAEVGEPILESRQIAAALGNGIVPLPAQFDREGDDAMPREVAAERFVIERRAAESMHGDDDRARELRRLEFAPQAE